MLLCLLCILLHYCAREDAGISIDQCLLFPGFLLRLLLNLLSELCGLLGPAQAVLDALQVDLELLDAQS